MKCALVLITGDRVDYIDKSIESCKKMINEFNSDLHIDIYIITFQGVTINSTYEFTQLTFSKPEQSKIDNFPKTLQQFQNYSNDIEQNRRISFGHYILNGAVPNIIFNNTQLFNSYNYIFKSRTDLVFDFNSVDIKNFNPDIEVLTFECFWGGCRYNNNFTNDHIIFGKSEDVLKVISYPISNCLLNEFWNPEHYTTYLFSQTKKNKKQLSTDKYFLLSKDRDSRKWIGFPLEKINNDDLKFLEKIGVDYKNIKFTNDYE